MATESSNQSVTPSGPTCLVSMVGVGVPGKGYEVVQYERKDGSSVVESKWCAQAFAVELGLGPSDSALLLSTPESRGVADELAGVLTRHGLGKVLHMGLRGEDLAWQDWAKELAERVRATGGERVVFDMTHGFRSHSGFVLRVLDYLDSLGELQLCQVVYAGQLTPPSKYRLYDLNDLMHARELADAGRQWQQTGDAEPLLRYLREEESVLRRVKPAPLKGARLDRKRMLEKFSTLAAALRLGSMPDVQDSLADIQELQRGWQLDGLDGDPRVKALGGVVKALLGSVDRVVPSKKGPDLGLGVNLVQWYLSIQPHMALLVVIELLLSRLMVEIGERGTWRKRSSREAPGVFLAKLAEERGWPAGRSVVVDTFAVAAKPLREERNRIAHGWITEGGNPESALKRLGDQVRGILKFLQQDDLWRELAELFREHPVSPKSGGDPGRSGEQ